MGNCLPAGCGQYPESRLAHQLLDQLTGIEIGASAANPFGLKTKNVDNIDHCRDRNTPYAREQLRACGRIAEVNVVAEGAKLPFSDKSVDYVIASHVVEHFYDPIAAIGEWVRVARRYVYLTVPHKFRTLDRHRPLTNFSELLERHNSPYPPDASHDKHWSVWTTESFVELVEKLGLPVAAIQDVDDKIGNGFTVVIGDLQQTTHHTT